MKRRTLQNLCFWVWALAVISIIFSLRMTDRNARNLTKRTEELERIVNQQWHVNTNHVAGINMCIKAIERIDAENKWHVYYYHTPKEEKAVGADIEAVLLCGFAGATNGLRFVNGFLVEKAGGVE